MDSIILVGPRGSGKSGVGRVLEERSGLHMIDADEKFAEIYGPISAFVQNSGWKEFRAHETEALKGICRAYERQRIILATGGGAVAHGDDEALRQSNVRLLRALGTVFYIIPYCDLEKSELALASRIDNDVASASSRPLLAESETLRERHPKYFAAAHHVIYTGDMAQTQIADSICAIVRRETSPALKTIAQGLYSLEPSMER